MSNIDEKLKRKEKRQITAQSSIKYWWRYKISTLFQYSKLDLRPSSKKKWCSSRIIYVLTNKLKQEELKLQSMFDFYEMDGWSTVLTKQLTQMLVNDVHTICAYILFFFFFGESQSFDKICVTFKGFVSISLQYPNIKCNNKEIRLFINGAIFQLFDIFQHTEIFENIHQMDHKAQ